MITKTHLSILAALAFCLPAPHSQAATKQAYRTSRVDETVEQSVLMVASQKDLALQPQEPVFVPPTSIPSKEFNVLDYGAKADGTTLNSRPIQAAIDAAAAAGGGHVIIPSGQFLCGPILLKNNIDLHLDKGAVLRMSRNFDDFPVRGNDHQAFILAAHAHDVEISGEGLIDGQGERWWEAFRKVKGTASTGPRRPQMILFADCQRVKLEGFSTRNPPGVHCAMRDCSEVIIQGLTMTAPEDSPNTDALNLRVKRAVIRKCRIATGDDNIVLCSGTKPRNGNPLTEDVTISDCKLGVGHGLSIGSYTTGGVRNVRCENIEFEGTTSGIRLKSARNRGGLVEQLVYRNLNMKNVRYPIVITSYYPKMPKQPWDDAEQSAGATTPFWRNVTIENLSAIGAQTAMIFWGLPERPVSDISLKNVNVSAEKGGNCCFSSNIRCSEVQIKAASGPCMLTYQGGITGVEATPMKAPTTKPVAGKRITVSADGKGDFKAVQDAIAAVPDNGKERTVIHIAAGTYAEPIVVPEAKINLTLEGDGPEKTILDWNRSVYDPIPEGHDKFNPGLHVRAPDFRAENLTIRNSAGDRRQALAARVVSDRVVFKNCHILGWQDTLMLENGRSCFKGCRIEGRVDFIYGNGTAVFDRCEIKSKNGGHVTAANTPADHPYGFVFLDCKLTGDPAPWIDPRTNQPPRPSMGKPMADLGRPWGPHASVTYLNCEMGDHIMLAGWNNWGKSENEKTARYAEYNSTGPGANPEARAPWAKQLTKEEAAKITIESVIGGEDGWRPQ